MKTRQMVFTALFISLVFVSTFIRIKFPIGAGGLVHLGTLTSFAIALKYGKRFGALSGGIGMALFDIFSEWAVWAPGTFVVRLLSGFSIGYLAQSKKGQGKNIGKNIFALIIGSIIIVVGYYFFEAIFLTDFNAAFASIPGNLMQIAIGTFALAIVHALPDLEEGQYLAK